ncbi:hypothetical protein FRC19_007520 [Serendipita sp. 401]|nr:hypothetical protein FRC19_007520 [Serendipita sp. 401]
MAAESSVLQPRTPPRNPQHSEAISDPWSACSTLTPLSTTLSPTPVLIPIHSLVLPVENSTREFEKHLKLQSSHSSTPDGSCTPRALKRRHSASSLEDAFQGLLSPQRRTISEKQIVGSSKRLIPTPYADPQNYQSFSSDEDEHPRAHGSKLHNSNDELLGDYAQYVEAPEWSDEDLEDLQRCLKEDGLSECLHEYLTIRNIGIPKLLRAFGKNIPVCDALTVM